FCDRGRIASVIVRAAMRVGGTIDDVLAQMRAIEASTAPRDGVAWFNRLYMRVTENVSARLGSGFFANDVYIARTDVVFAGYYFRAIAAPVPPRSWEPLLDARADDRIAPLAFALAGMNAHINHDLAHAVFDVALEGGGPVPARGSAEHADYL